MAGVPIPPNRLHTKVSMMREQDKPANVRNYMTVADPAAGHANYIVTAVTHGAQRRYGRKRINGVMSGRDPALLPGCP